MRMSRARANQLNRILDDWLPPRLRDSRPMAALARRMFADLPIRIDEFKDRAFRLSRGDMADFYRNLDSRFDLGATDLTDGSMRAVVDSVAGGSVLDVACGKGALADRLSAEHHVVGCDVAVDRGDRALAHRSFTAVEAVIESLPFASRCFDTVVSTHTIEHVLDPRSALDELRRVARRRVVVVVPRQRPYRVTFNPHLHFFPYEHSLLAWTGTDHVERCELVDDDWLYVEDVASRG